jgi:hypothetical protein
MSAPCVDCGLLSVANCCGMLRSAAAGHTQWTTIHIHPRRRQHCSSLRGTCNPLKWQLAAETCQGNLMATTKAYNTLEHFLLSCTGKYKIKIIYIYIYMYIYRSEHFCTVRNKEKNLNHLPHCCYVTVPKVCMHLNIPLYVLCIILIRT